MLTYTELCDLVRSGVIDAPLDHVGPASIDVRLGDMWWYEEEYCGACPYVDLADNHRPAMGQVQADQYAMAPGEFILAQTMEHFFMPDDLGAEFRLRSSMARCGLDNALAVWIDPGFSGSVLTLELRNNLRHHALTLTAGMRIGQLIFHRGAPVPADRSYRAVGRYNGDLTAQPSRGAS